jgi:hypothetical protein
MGQAASEGWVSFPAEAGASGAPRARGIARSGLAYVGGAVATVAAVTLAAILTLVFAATLAVAAVLTAALVGLYAVTHRRRPQGVLIEARKVGHSWVAYGWDQRPR